MIVKALRKHEARSNNYIVHHNFKFESGDPESYLNKIEALLKFIVFKLLN